MTRVPDERSGLGAATDDLPTTSDARVRSGQPSSRPRPASWAEAIPLLALLALVQLSVPLFGSLEYPALFWVSTGLLLALPVVFWDRYPRAIFSAALIYLASACCLNIAATGNENAGLGVLLFLPVVGVAVAGTRRHTGMTVAAVAVAAMVISLFDRRLDRGGGPAHGALLRDLGGDLDRHHHPARTFAALEGTGETLAQRRPSHERHGPTACRTDRTGLDQMHRRRARRHRWFPTR